MPYQITVTRMRGDRSTGSVVIEVPDQHAYDPVFGVQVADLERPGEMISLFDDELIDAAARGDYGLKVVGFDVAKARENLGREQEAPPVANAAKRHE